MSDKEYEIANPGAGAMIESLRAVGYNLPTAIADVIDNSISAEARNVWLDFEWNGSDSWISIRDDGHGMSEYELTSAMRPGSKSPLEVRSPEDLGRFGLGLKTASFSQCRSLSVITKDHTGNTSERRWDLSYVEKHNEWRLLKSATETARSIAESLSDQRSGTIVVWEILDRVVDNSPVNSSSAHKRFLKQLDDVREHLAMTFHRYLETPGKRLSIWINGTSEMNEVEPWDPFLSSNSFTKRTPFEEVDFGDSVVTIKGYVLPHKDKLGTDLHRVASGPKGWNAQQGFYVYRNDRMLVSGDWLKLGRNRAWTKEEHYKLARISIDIPNTLDSQWNLDVKKSTARPPAHIREKLLKLAESVRKDARKVFAHRGEYGPREQGSLEKLERPWKSVSRGGHTIYRIRRDHLLVKSLVSALEGAKKEVEELLRYIEETVPIQKIWLDSAEDADGHCAPYEGLGESVIEADIKSAIRRLVDSGMPMNEAKQKLAMIEPFNRQRAFIDSLSESDLTT